LDRIYQCTRENFLEKMRTAHNGALTINGEEIFFVENDGDLRKSVYMVPDLRQFSNIEVVAFIADIKDMMAFRTGRPGQKVF
jgi:hypothetical protein